MDVMIISPKGVGTVAQREVCMKKKETCRRPLKCSHLRARRNVHRQWRMRRKSRKVGGEDIEEEKKTRRG